MFYFLKEKFTHINYSIDLCPNDQQQQSRQYVDRVCVPNQMVKFIIANLASVSYCRFIEL